MPASRWPTPAAGPFDQEGIRQTLQWKQSLNMGNLLLLFISVKDIVHEGKEIGRYDQVIFKNDTFPCSFTTPVTPSMMLRQGPRFLFSSM